jgi:predicted cupin superfamily sugar epimerase
MSRDPAPLTVEDVVRALDLAPHPEGGFYRETFRDPRTGPEGRSHSTAIYFLLPAGVVSRWHRVDAAEVWHWYAGAPLALSRSAPGGARETLTLGADLAQGERPQAIVPAGWWQQAVSLGAWTLAGCTVAPAFTFAGFEMLSSNAEP